MALFITSATRDETSSKTLLKKSQKIQILPLSSSLTSSSSSEESEKHCSTSVFTLRIIGGVAAAAVSGSTNIAAGLAGSPLMLKTGDWQLLADPVEEPSAAPGVTLSDPGVTVQTADKAAPTLPLT